MSKTKKQKKTRESGAESREKSPGDEGEGFAASSVRATAGVYTGYSSINLVCRLNADAIAPIRDQRFNIRGRTNHCDITSDTTHKI